MADYEKLGFEIDAVDNASAKLSNVLGLLNQIKTTLGSMPNMKGLGFGSSGNRKRGLDKGFEQFQKTGHLIPKEYKRAVQQGNIIAHSSMKQVIAREQYLKNAHTRDIERRKIVNKHQLKEMRNNIEIELGYKKIAKAKLVESNVKLNKSLYQTSNGLTKVTKSAHHSLLKLGALTLVTRKLTKAFFNAVHESGQFRENLNLFAVTFGKDYKKTVDWSLDFANNLGYASNEIIRFTGLFKQLATSIGIVDDVGTDMAQTLTQLGYDLASFYNISVQSAFEKLQAGIFSGQTKPLRSLGLDITYQTLDNLLKTNEAFKQFGVSSKQLSQADKSMLRLIVVLQNASNAFGDVQKTISSFENQIRVFQGSIANLKLALGDVFREPFAEALVYINGLIIGITNLIRAFHPLDTTAEFAGNAMQQFADDTEDAEEKLNKGNLLDIDKFRVLNKGDDKQLSISKAITEELKKQQGIYSDYLKNLDEMNNKAIEIGKNIKNWFVFDTGEVDEKGNPIYQWTEQAENLGIVLTTLSSIIGSLLILKIVDLVSNLGKVIIKFDKTTLSIGILLTGITILAIGINSIAHAWDNMNGWEKALSAIVSLTAAVAGLVFGLNVLKLGLPAAIGLSAAFAGGVLLATSAIEKNAQGLANGGITDANLIKTHENGVREWVGQQNHSAAVVNDTEMSTVMEQAVSKGVLDALVLNNDSSSGNINLNLHLDLDGQTVYESVEEYAKQNGKRFTNV